MTGRSCVPTARWSDRCDTSVQLVFQDPHASFDPRRTVGRSVGLPLRAAGVGRERRGHASASCSRAWVSIRSSRSGIPGPCPGGSSSARPSPAPSRPEPDILVCDEPVASMDVSVRAQILNLLLDLRRTRGIGILFVSHDLGVVRRIADRVAVMYLGRIVETGGSESIWRLPRHPYTRALAGSIPPAAPPGVPGRVWPRLQGEPPSPVDVPPGCRFHPRCPIAIDRCRTDDPVLRPFPPDVEVACHLAELAATPTCDVGRVTAAGRHADLRWSRTCHLCTAGMHGRAPVPAGARLATLERRHRPTRTLSSMHPVHDRRVRAPATGRTSPGRMIGRNRPPSSTPVAPGTIGRERPH